MTGNIILINRASVLTLWAAVVAECLGFNHDEALSLGRALAGLNAQSKGRRLGIFKPTPQEIKKVREGGGTRNFGWTFWGELCQRWSLDPREADPTHQQALARLLPQPS